MNPKPRRAVISADMGLLTCGRRTLPGQGTWQATLEPRDLNGDGKPDAYYDTELDITWLQRERADELGERQRMGSRVELHGVKRSRLPTLPCDPQLNFDHGYVGTDCGYNIKTKSGATTYSEMGQRDG